MPLPPLVAFVLVTGLAAALAGRHELRMSPRPIPLTRGFLSYVSYATLVVVPVSVYFYVFHGDWFLLYFFDVQRIPSAVALVGFMAEAGLGTFGFVLGAVLIRNQRETIAAILAGLALIAGVVVVALYSDRLAQVGSHAQFHGQFGLVAYEDGSLITGGLTMGVIALAGLALLLTRLWLGGKTR